MEPAAILASDRLIASAGGALALSLAESGPAGLVLFRSGVASDAQGPLPLPTPSAARAARELRTAGHRARASWRLVRCEVEGVDEARAALEILSCHCGAPVLACSSPREGLLDGLLRRCRLLLAAADSPAALAALDDAVESLAQLGRPTAALTLDQVGIGSVLPAAGITVPSAWREQFDLLDLRAVAGSRHAGLLP